MTFGPWSPQLDEPERRARCRAMRALALLILSPRHPLFVALGAAETDDRALARALELVDALPAIPRRRLLCSYAALQPAAHPREVQHA